MESLGFTFAVSIKLLLLPAQLRIKLAIELHLKHLGQHQVAGRVCSRSAGQVQIGTENYSKYMHIKDVFTIRNYDELALNNYTFCEKNPAAAVVIWG